MRHALSSIQTSVGDCLGSFVSAMFPNLISTSARHSRTGSLGKIGRVCESAPLSSARAASLLFTVPWHAIRAGEARSRTASPAAAILSPAWKGDPCCAVIHKKIAIRLVPFRQLTQRSGSSTPSSQRAGLQPSVGGPNVLPEVHSRQRAQTFATPCVT